MQCAQAPPPRKVPKDGPGPRGLPDCYYVSRVLNSTFRYARFVKRLRALEEEQRRGAENTLKELRDKQISGFFLRCDRRSLINNVARRVDLCLRSYEEDLQQKRLRLIDLFTKEEEEDIRKFVVQTQEGVQTIWNEKMDRLQYLLAKRKKEHEDRYKDTPLSKCVHVLPCIVKLRAKESQEYQLYQMREKQAMKMAEMERDKMWYDVAMKEAEALAARLEQDAIERYRRDMDCKKYSDYQLEQKRLQEEKDREILKQETLMLKAVWDEDNRKEEEAERQRQEKRKETARQRDEMIEERRQKLAKQKEDDEKIKDAWDSLSGKGLADEKAQADRRRRKEMELDICNRKMIELRDCVKAMDDDNEEMMKEAQAQQKAIDRKRCEYLTWSQATNREVRNAMIDQIKDRKEASETLKKKLKEEDEYQKQVFEQLESLADHQALVDAQAKKKYQNDLLAQIEYNKLLKKKAREEELNQIKKCQIATQEYDQEIKKMLGRQFYSDEVHPFMKQMARNLRMREKCPCSKPDYCKQ